MAKIDISIDIDIGKFYARDGGFYDVVPVLLVDVEGDLAGLLLRIIAGSP